MKSSEKKNGGREAQYILKVRRYTDEVSVNSRTGNIRVNLNGRQEIRGTWKTEANRTTIEAVRGLGDRFFDFLGRLKDSNIADIAIFYRGELVEQIH